MAQDSPPSSSKKRPLLVIILLLIAVIASAAAGYSWWQLQHINDLQAVKEEPSVAPVFMSLDTFTVNLVNPENNPDRVLYIGITLRLPDDKTRKQLNDYLPEVRSRLLMLLSRQEADKLSSEEGKQQLIAQIKEVLSPPLIAGKPKQVITDVLFTAFILR
ncbi:flagellar basal body-associated protein FliL [Enterobacteriaceae bacterium ESL0689]|nr:flagellar basal body-associated protein FliL [Enterobacteriaceae bacterium ESL0689]